MAKTYLIIISVFLILGCPAEEAQPGRTDAGPGMDPSQGDTDAGTQGGQTEVVDGGGQTSQSETTDSGTPSDSSGSTVTCGTVLPMTLSLSVADDTLAPRLITVVGDDVPGGTTNAVVGEMERWQLGVLFETAPRAADNLPYRWICDDHGLTFDFVDTADGVGSLDGEANDSDTLSRIVANASSPISFLGSPINTLTPQMIQSGIGALDNSLDASSYAVHTFTDTIQMVVYPTYGFSYLLSIVGTTPGSTDIRLDGTILSLTFFKPQENDNWGAPINLTAPSLTLNNQTLSASQGLGGGANFSSVPQILGNAYDVSGAIEGDGFMLNIVTYASLGLRFVEGCGENPLPIGDPFICSGKVTVIVISSPFMGVDTATGLRLGSTRAEVEAAFGVGAARVDEDSGGEVYVYGDSDPLLGIIYAADAANVERVGAFILNYIDET